MTKLTSEFFRDNEIIFWDQTQNGMICPISKSAMKEMQKQGIEVYVINKGNTESLNSLRKIPRSAYVLCNKNDAKDIILKLNDKGIQRILFHPFCTPELNIIQTCSEHNMEIVSGCPNMVFGNGICKIHASFA